MIIAIDFDGTCVEHEFPAIGPDVPGAVDWLKRYTAAGAYLILWMMRSDGREQGFVRDPLSKAVAWFGARGIPLWGVNGNPGQHTWTASPKAYAHVYVDDAAACCPLVENPRHGGRPFVDWSIVGPAVMRQVEAAHGTAGAV